MRVVHCKVEPYTHYIGRPGPLGNPYTHLVSRVPGVEVVGSRQEAIEKFEQYARGNARVLRAIEELPKDAVLGCWCKPRACHGEVIIKLWKEIYFKP